MSITWKHKTTAYEIRKLYIRSEAYCTGKNKSPSLIKTAEVSPSLDWVQFCGDPGGMFSSGLIESSQRI